MNSGVAVRSRSNERVNLLFLLRREERISLQEPVQTVFDVLKLRGIYVYGMQFLAKSRELARVFLYSLGLVSAGARIRAFALHAAETDAYLLAVGHQITRLRRRNTHFIYFLRQRQL